LRSFDLAVVFITPAGRIGTARGLSPASRISAAWWTQGRAAAESVLVAIGEHHPGTLECATRAVLQAAARLGVVLGEHETVVARARAAIGKLDGKLAAAQQLGDLRFFNRAYKRYRLDCLRRGGRPMPYGTAVAKLRKALAGAAAGAPITSLLGQVFEP
jgi:hypothetical protein